MGAPPENPCDALAAESVHHPLHVAATAMAFSRGPQWKETTAAAQFFTRRGGPSVALHAHLSGAVRCTTKVPNVHPFPLCAMLNSEEFKRESDKNILEFRVVEKASDFCSIIYQKTSLGAMLEHRDAVYASMVVDVNPDLVMMIEWPVEVASCPQVPRCHRSRSFFCYEAKAIRHANSVHTRLTVTAVVNMGGSLGSRFMRPLMGRGTAEALSGGLAELSKFFDTDEGSAAMLEVQGEVLKSVCKGLRAELPASAASFMDMLSEVFKQVFGEPCLEFYDPLDVDRILP